MIGVLGVQFTFDGDVVCGGIFYSKCGFWFVSVNVPIK